MAPIHAALRRPGTGSRFAARELAITVTTVLIALVTAFPTLGATRVARGIAAGPDAGGPAALPELPAADPARPPGWINVTNNATGPLPPAGYGGAMAYDPPDRETVYFGGCGAAGCPSNETWAFANGTWTNLTDPHHAPPARQGAVMDYDANLRGLLLFGGVRGATYLNDTWLFRDGVWTDLSWVGPAPTPRAWSTLAFDPDPEENGSVLFGGAAKGIGYANDTWIWEGWSGWVTLKTSIAPPPTADAGMAYDASDRLLVLYCPDPVNRTWELYAGQWWLVSPPGAVPSLRYGAAVAYDPALSAVVLFGGVHVGYLNDTWTFSKGAWESIALATAPSPRAYARMALDASGSVPILYGGRNATARYNSTWTFEPRPAPSLSTSAPAPETSVNVSFTATVSGGTPPFRALIAFGDGAGRFVTSLGPALTATHAYGEPGVYVPSVNVADDVGASASATAPALAIASGPSVTASAEPSPADVGIPVTFASHVLAPGTPPVTYAWRFGDGAAATGPQVSHAYSGAGTYVADVRAVDSAGGVSDAAVSVQVSPPLAASVGVDVASPVAGAPVAFHATLSGGSAPYRFLWVFGDGSSSSFPAPMHTFNGSGSYTVELWVNDSAGGSAHATTRVDVASTSPPGGEVPLWVWVLLATLIVILAAAGALLVAQRRRGRPPGPAKASQRGGAEQGPSAQEATEPKPPEELAGWRRGASNAAP